MFKVIGFVMDSKTHKWERINDINSETNDIEKVKSILLRVPGVERVLFTLKETK